MPLNNIHTARLMLIPVTLEITTGLIKGDLVALEALGIKAHADWPTNDTKDILPIVNRTLASNGSPSGFEFWMIVHSADQTIIGDIGFHGKPDVHGDVEIGFGLVEEAHGKGYGSEGFNGIINWLKTQNDVKKLYANCLIDNHASYHLLIKNGMKEIYRNTHSIYFHMLF